MAFRKKCKADRTPHRRADRYIDNSAGIIVLGIYDHKDPILQLVKEADREAHRSWMRRNLTIILYFVSIGVAMYTTYRLTKHKSVISSDSTPAAPAHIVLYMPDDITTLTGGGGGGGGNSPKKKVPASMGRTADLKKFQLTPPTTQPSARRAELEAPPSLEGAIEAQAPTILLDRFGDPLTSPLIPPADGSGATGGIGSGKNGGIGSGNGRGFGPGGGGGAGNGKGRGIGRGIGSGMSQKIEKVSLPMPIADAEGRPLNRLIVQHRGRQLTFALHINSLGSVDDVYLPGGRGLDAFEKLFLMEHVKLNWKMYVVWQGEDRDLPADLEKHRDISPGHQHYHIREWVVFTVKF